MSVINDVLLSVIDLAEDNLTLYSPIKIGALPADNSLSIQITTGAADGTFMTKGMAYEITCVLNGKHESQKTVSDTLNDIHQYLTQLKAYPRTENTYQITNIETVSTPSYIDREANKQYLYGSSIRIKFFYMKG